MLATPPFWASSNIALMRANSKPPLEVVVADLEIEKSFCDKRFSKRLSFASFARAGNDQLLSELEVSAIKPKQNEGSERLAVAEGVLDFFL